MWNETTSLFLLGDVITEGAGFLQYTMIKQNKIASSKDEWFSDDLKKIDYDDVFRKMQGHWIIETSEMTATANARSRRTGCGNASSAAHPIRCHIGFRFPLAWL